MPSTQRLQDSQLLTQVLIVNLHEESSCRELASFLTASDITVQTVQSLESTFEQLRQGSIHLIILAAIWGEEGTERILALIRGTAPDIPILFYSLSNTPPPAKQVADAKLLGPVLPGDSTATILGWINTAKSMSETRHALSIAWQAVTDLSQLTAQLSAPYQFETLLDTILQTFLQIISREVTDIQAAPPTGAILLMGNDGRIVVHAANGSYVDYLHAPLPDSLQAQVIQVAEARSTYSDGSQIIVPFYWNDSLHGILVVEGESLPLEISATMKMVVTNVAVILENTLLFELAAVDTTTRAYTRAFTLQRLYESLKSTYRTGQELTILMMDLDRFKHINDTYGHLTGDLALHKVGELMRTALRETDILGRYGGDEFLLILPNTPISGGLEVATRLMQFITDFRLDVNGDQVSLGISIGIGGISHGEEPEVPSIRPRH
ncbi:MAG TPA: diguanylate cyclase, partial [Armatimonadota bacterium]|nr:diguanylate cyclase [Armatimonadota bacterium]